MTAVMQLLCGRADPDGPSLAEQYQALGHTRSARNARRNAACQFTTRFATLQRWRAASTPRRLDAPVAVRSYVAWMLLTTGTPGPVDYVVASGSSWGLHAAAAYPDFAGRFTATATAIGFTTQQTQRQWATLAKLAAITGLDPEQLHQGDLDQAYGQLLAEVRSTHGGHAPNTLTTPVHGLSATLTAVGTLAAPRRKAPTHPSTTVHWDHLAGKAPDLVATMRRYLAQLGLSLRPGSVTLIDTTLRHLADYLTEHHPQVLTAAGIRRTHIEGFKTALAARPGYRGHREPAKTTLGMRLGHLHGFFDRIIEWGYPDAPARNPVFAGDLPLRDRPLPRFLDDAQAAKLLSAARALPDLFDRVCVETLAHTGLRKGEFLGLDIDAIVVLGAHEWLRTPVGKLHTDRYIPLHPRVKLLLGQWRAHRGDLPNTRLLFTDRGRPIPGSRVDRAVHTAATNAGIGHVTPHQLRHTLATQAINRGMSLEAIAALLGHTSMSMTMTYARIADHTVADEYFAVTSKVEALYTPTDLPADAEGPNMRRLHAETTDRLLGTGTCTRPTEIGCRYQTICETCDFFTPSIAARDIVQAQHEDAKTHGDHDHKNAYANVLIKLDRIRT
jgi:integrase